MPGKRITDDQKMRLRRLVYEDGLEIKQASAIVGIHINSATGILDGRGRSRKGDDGKIKRSPGKGALPLEKVGPEAKRALGPEQITADNLPEAVEAFDYFSLRYFGHIQSPWQKEAAGKLIALDASPDREYVVINCPPGAGKSTIAVRLACWWIVKDRTTRILFGSRTHPLAARNTARVRRALERVTPAKAKPDELEMGLAVDAEACLALDYGRFKPVGATEIWRRDEFMVEQLDGSFVDEKEPTLSAYGIEGDELGNRFNRILWDDLDSNRTIRTLDAINNQRTTYDDEAESRLEGRGLLALIQQRLSAQDMSSYNLAKLVDPESEDDEPQSQYHHIIYKAHYDSLCKGQHSKDAPAYPDGCLLEPMRLPWRDLRNFMRKPNFNTVYQQEDENSTDALVKRIWIEGGTDPETGELHVGCWDSARTEFVRPDTDYPLMTVISTDPSGSAMWGHTMWAIDKKNGFRYLIAHKRERMQASDVLDYNPQTREFTGMLEDWTAAAKANGLPVSYWIIEQNAAQRWIYRYKFFELWSQTRGVTRVAHNTAVNKLDPERGVESTLPPIYRSGLVRFPGTPSARAACLDFVDELTHFIPGAGKHLWPSDLLMSQWFVEYKLPDLSTTTYEGPLEVPPTWMRRSA